MKTILLIVLILGSTTSFGKEELACIEKIEMNHCYYAMIDNKDNTSTTEGYICSADVLLENGDYKIVEGVRAMKVSKVGRRLIENANDESSRILRATSAVGVLLIEVPRYFGKVLATKNSRIYKLKKIIKKHKLCDPNMRLPFKKPRKGPSGKR